MSITKIGLLGKDEGLSDNTRTVVAISLSSLLFPFIPYPMKYILVGKEWLQLMGIVPIGRGMTGKSR